MGSKIVLTMSGRQTAELLDEDNMASDDAFGVPTQQSVKAYVDTQVGARKIYLRGEIENISAAKSSWVISPVAGNITAITTVIDTAITLGDANITFEIAGVPVTGGAITIAFTGSAAGDIDSAIPTAANTVTAGQAIEIITDGGSTGVSKAVVLMEITV